MSLVPEIAVPSPGHRRRRKCATLSCVVCIVGFSHTRSCGFERVTWCARRRSSIWWMLRMDREKVSFRNGADWILLSGRELGFSNMLCTTCTSGASRNTKAQSPSSFKCSGSHRRSLQLIYIYIYTHIYIYIHVCVMYKLCMYICMKVYISIQDQTLENPIFAT